jgi:hypothetical protein
MNQQKVDSEINSQKFFLTEKDQRSGVKGTRALQHSVGACKGVQHSGGRGRGALASQNSKTCPEIKKTQENPEIECVWDESKSQQHI